MSVERVSADFPLAILAKAPIPGQAKTRLIPALGPAGAARLHEALVRHTLAMACSATAPRHITLWTALDPAHPLFLELAERHGVALRAQPAGDLGTRMHHALSEQSAPGLLIGTDCPIMTAALLRRCHRELADVETVFLPADDGGYALVGVRRSDPRLFSHIAWGGDGVMAATRERLARLGWRLACPAEVWDVDRPEDLARLSTTHPALADVVRTAANDRSNSTGS